MFELPQVGSKDEAGRDIENGCRKPRLSDAECLDIDFPSDESQLLNRNGRSERSILKKRYEGGASFAA